MAKPTKQIRIWLELDKDLERLAKKMATETGLDVSQTEAASLAIRNELDRRTPASKDKRIAELEAALIKVDPWSDYIPFTCRFCGAVYDNGLISITEAHKDGCIWNEARKAALKASRP